MHCNSSTCSPSISVIIPAYNAAAYIGDSIRSALRQTAPPAEIVVVDDGSTDGTDRVLENLQGDVSNSIVLRVIHQINAGPAVARNTGIQAATGEWIAFLDSDDLWFPDKLALQLETIKQLSSPALICGEVTTFHDTPPRSSGARSAPRTREYSFEQLIQRNRIATSTVMLPREYAASDNSFDPRYRGPEDWHFWLRLAARGLPVCKLPLPLTAYRITPNSLSQQVIRMRDQEMEIVSNWMRVRGERHEASENLVRRAKAGVHLRAALMFAEAGRSVPALSEIFMSITFWPLSLPEYANIKLFIRLKIVVRILREVLFPTQVTAHC